MATTGVVAMTGVLHQYVIYDHPKDFPDSFVIREWEIHGGGMTPGEAWAVSTLEEARRLIPPGLFCIPRTRRDDPVIVEVWT